MTHKPGKPCLSTRVAKWKAKETKQSKQNQTAIRTQPIWPGPFAPARLARPTWPGPFGPGPFGPAHWAWPFLPRARLGPGPVWALGPFGPRAHWAQRVVFSVCRFWGGFPTERNPCWPRPGARPRSGAPGPWALPQGPFIWPMGPGPMGHLFSGILALLFPCVALLFPCVALLFPCVACRVLASATDPLTFASKATR